MSSASALAAHAGQTQLHSPGAPAGLWVHLRVLSPCMALGGYYPGTCWGPCHSGVLCFAAFAPCERAHLIPVTVPHLDAKNCNNGTDGTCCYTKAHFPLQKQKMQSWKQSLLDLKRLSCCVPRRWRGTGMNPIPELSRGALCQSRGHGCANQEVRTRSCAWNAAEELLLRLTGGRSGPY